MSETEKTSFDTLIGEIDMLAKAEPADTAADDAAIQAAAGEGEGEGEEKKPEDEGGEPPLKKSFSLKLEDGSVVEAVDGAELIKALTVRLESTEGTLAKSLDANTKLFGLVKSLTEDVAALKSAGKGRKSVLAVVEKPAPTTEELRKSQEPEGMNSDQFMAKAMSLMASGTLLSSDIALAEQYINMGQTPPAHIVNAVLNG